ncbi:MAG TPA: trypsin-like peptidase domain-containing protein, partial [Verrucomicrobium sp.]|nr:trypsin-like peptidase domain-containing protein [Verrucomicrobium sp.]
AEAGESEAQLNMGWRYQRAMGVPKDIAIAESWFRKAAVQGHKDAQAFYASVLVESGRVKEAVPWCQESAAYGSPLAQSILGELYLAGEGVPRNAAKAWQWWSMAQRSGGSMLKSRMTQVRPYLSAGDIATGEREAAQFKLPNVPDVDKDPDGATVATFYEALGTTSPLAWGTGFFIREDGYFMTTHRIATAGKRIRIMHESGLLRARVLASDARSGQALLKVQGAFRALALADGPSSTKAQPVYVGKRSGSDLGSTLKGSWSVEPGQLTPTKSVEGEIFGIVWEEGSLPHSCEGAPILLGATSGVVGMVPYRGSSSDLQPQGELSPAVRLRLPADMPLLSVDASWTGWRRTEREFDDTPLGQFTDLREATAYVLVYE